MLGGCQSLHTNSKDELGAALCLRPLCRRCAPQQIIAHETGVTDTVDPLGGSYFVEALTNQVESGAYDYFERIDPAGRRDTRAGIRLLPAGDCRRRYIYRQEEDRKERITVGVNDYVAEDGKPVHSRCCGWMRPASSATLPT